MAAPTDWQGQAMKAVKQMRADNPAEVLYGVGLPADWASDLRTFVRKGEVQKLLGVSRVTFIKGKNIVRIDRPEPKAE